MAPGLEVGAPGPGLPGRDRRTPAVLQQDFARIWSRFENINVDGGLFSLPESVCYLTGYANQSDMSFPFKGCPLLVLAVKGQDPVAVVPATEQSDLTQASWIRNILTYTNHDYSEPVDPAAAALEGATQAIRQYGIGKGKIGIEALHLPASLRQGLSERFPYVQWPDITGCLSPLRAIKNPEELDAIRKSAQLCDVGQARVRELVARGRSEITLFAEARARMEQFAGCRIQIAGDLVTGERSGREGGGLPGNELLEEGHLVISDIVPRLNGWWADSCATLAVGEPSREQKRIYGIVMDAFHIGIEVAKPGVRASEIDAVVRGYVEKHGYQYGHHTGHGVGVAQAEAPWIVPYNDQVLQEGMVITIEPGIYPGGMGGIRIEDSFVVTKDHLEPLTRHDKQLKR